MPTNNPIDIVRIRITVALGGEAKEWLRSTFPEIWEDSGHGDLFFEENLEEWRNRVATGLKGAVGGHFRKLGMAKQSLPRVEIHEARTSPLEIHADVTALAPALYVSFRGGADLPKIPDGLGRRVEHWLRSLDFIMRKKIRQRIETTFLAEERPATREERSELTGEIPKSLLDVKAEIDDGPLRAFVKGIRTQHTMQISVTITRTTLVLENLGDSPLTDVRVGITLFEGNGENLPSHAETCYFLTIPRCSRCHSIQLTLADFSDDHGAAPDLTANERVAGECRVETDSGSFTFAFLMGE